MAKIVLEDIKNGDDFLGYVLTSDGEVLDELRISSCDSQMTIKHTISREEINSFDINYDQHIPTLYEMIMGIAEERLCGLDSLEDCTDYGKFPF